MVESLPQGGHEHLHLVTTPQQEGGLRLVKNLEGNEVTLFLNGLALDEEVDEGVINHGALLLSSAQEFASAEEWLENNPNIARGVAAYNASHDTDYSFHEILGEEYYGERAGFSDLTKELRFDIQNVNKKFGYLPVRERYQEKIKISPNISPLDIYVEYSLKKKNHKEVAYTLGVGVEQVINDREALGIPLNRTRSPSEKHKRLGQTERRKYQQKLSEQVGDDPITVIKSLYGNYGMDKKEIAKHHDLRVEELDLGLNSLGTNYMTLVSEVSPVQGKLSASESALLENLPNIDLSILNPQQRYLLVKRIQSGDQIPSYDELGKELGISHEYARKQIHTAIEILQGLRPPKKRKLISQARKLVKLNPDLRYSK